MKPRTGCLILAALLAFGCGNEVENQPKSKLVLDPQPAKPSPGPPTTLRLVVELQPDGTLGVVSADPERGLVEPPPIEDKRNELLQGKVRLVEYRALDAAGAVIATGSFLFPVTAISEYQDPNVETRIRRQEELVIANPAMKISIAYRPEIAMIAFEGLVPDAQADVKSWRRTPMGQVRVNLNPDTI